MSRLRNHQPWTLGGTLGLGLLVAVAAPRLFPGSMAAEPASGILDRRVAIYVPGTVQVNRLHEQLAEQMMERALERFSRIFGGATAMPATGAWISKNGLVKEPIRIVYAFTTERTLDQQLPTVLSLAREICETMQQECVAVEVHGKLLLVER